MPARTPDDHPAEDETIQERDLEQRKDRRDRLTNDQARQPPATRGIRTNVVPATPPQNAIRFRVVAIERFALPNPAKQDHMVFRVEYLNEGTLRGTSFELTRERYLPYRDVINDALLSGGVYWVDWDYDTIPDTPHREGNSVAERLLKALDDHQVVRSEAKN